MKNKLLLVCSLFFLGITTTNAQYTDILNFNGTNGKYPVGSLTLSGNILYGVTQLGGVNGDGCIFCINKDGSGYIDLYDFTVYPTGANGSLILSVTGDTLFGTTGAGGTHNMGNIFSIRTNGSDYTDLYNFSYNEEPENSLVLSVTGDTLFGMTLGGGTHNLGYIFCIKTNGTAFTDILDFNGTNGSEPALGGLILAAGNLFGMTTHGGRYNDGIIFSIKTNGSRYTDLFDFNDTNGAVPETGLTLAGNTLYGTTAEGGLYNYGTIFSIKTNGSGYTDLLDFNNTNGNFPMGSLNLIRNTLYGVTSNGGANNGGCLFSINTNGSGYTDLLNFNLYNGWNPLSSLILSGDVLYGMASEGDKNYPTDNDGVIFGDTILRTKVSMVTNVSCNSGNNGSVSITQIGGTPPYTYLWSNGGTNPNETGLTAGTYTITITDNNGLIVTTSTTVTQPLAIIITHDSANETLGCNGIARVNISGGTSPYTYYWSVGHTNDTINNICAGTYTCIITDNNDCSQTTTVTVINTTGIGKVNSAVGLHIYPDPSTGYFTIIGLSKGEEIEVYNYMGQKVSSILVNNATMVFDISDKLTGMYLIRILNKDGSVVTSDKIVKIE